MSGASSDQLDRLAELISERTTVQGRINARLSDATEVRRLNRDYAGEDNATDVLSFNYRETTEVDVDQPISAFGDELPELGDVVISRQHVSRQASAAGTDEETELLLLLLHGSLHLLGYDHATLRQREEMDHLQAEIMTALGLSYRDFGWKSADMVT
ncbi:MAG: rRNA maturation RNase YbeY [Candidatus Saccharimonadales bacterium]